MNELTPEQKLKLLREVIIRFDTNPKFYQKEDYKFLLNLISVLVGDDIDLYKQVEDLRELIEQSGLDDAATKEYVNEQIDLLRQELEAEVILDWTPNQYDHI